MCRPHFCSMKIIEDVRETPPQQGLAEEEALAKGWRVGGRVRKWGGSLREGREFSPVKPFRRAPGRP